MLDNLVKILPPPSIEPPVEAAAWSCFESEWGVEFPGDYKGFISLYGGGVVDDFVWILSPFSVNGNINFEKSKYFQDSYVFMKRDFPGDYPRPDFPAEGSFLPWAVTDNGETFFWIVSGDPNSWKVGVHNVDQGEEECFNVGCVEFLVGLLCGDILSNILPVQFPPKGLDVHGFRAVG